MRQTNITGGLRPLRRIKIGQIFCIACRKEADCDKNNLWLCYGCAFLDKVYEKGTIFVVAEIDHYGCSSQEETGVSVVMTGTDLDKILKYCKEFTKNAELERINETLWSDEERSFFLEIYCPHPGK